MKHDLNDLIDARDIAEILGVISEIQVYKLLETHPKFPKPLVDRGGHNRARLWSKREVLNWEKTTDEFFEKNYIYYAVTGPFAKIGTSKNPHARIAYLRSDAYSVVEDKDLKKKIKLIGFTIGTFKMEKELHSKFENFRVSDRSREWFYNTPELEEEMKKFLSKVTHG